MILKHKEKLVYHCIGIKANGAIRLNNNISEIKKVKSIKLINQSVTGLFEQEIELLNL